jgi:hypothetical protein
MLQRLMMREFCGGRGDSFRTTNVTARAAEEVTKDVLAGKVKTEDALQAAQMRYLTKELKKLPKPKG